MPTPVVAISIKQPWAALVVAGLKTVEVRTWPTRRRGPVWIHAGKLADDRPEAWEWVTTPEVRDLAALRGGVVGAADVVGCDAYDTPEAFAAAAAAHRNPAAWFAPPRLYGFVLRRAGPVAFRPCPGQTMFFGVGKRVKSDTPAATEPGRAFGADETADAT